MITLTIDGREVEVKEGRTILEAARQHGLGTIPTLCYHEALAPFAACRMCLVELVNRRNGALAPACAYPCEQGLLVQTDSEKVRRSRRMTIELLMASAAHAPLIRAMAADLGVEAPRYSTEPDTCILCGLCVRACDEIVGVHAISLVNRGSEKRVSPPFHIASNVCIECGTCVLICPTGAITLADITGNRGGHAAHTWESQWTAADCRVCGDFYQEQQLVHVPGVLTAAQEAVS